MGDPAPCDLPSSQKGIQQCPQVSVLHGLTVGSLPPVPFAMAEGRGEGGRWKGLCSILALTNLRENNPSLELAWACATLTT